MQLTCLFEELDDATRGYLLAVAKAKGRGAPGVFVPQSSAGPWVAILAAPVVTFVMLWGSIFSGKDAWAIAMGQTAGVLLGGWLAVYAIRRWFGGVSDTYAGKFLYFDSLHVYQSAGESITITSLKSVQAVTAVPGENGFRVAFDLGGDRVLWVPMPSPGAAAIVEDFYAAMATLEQQEGVWTVADPATIGAGALYAAQTGDLPRDTNDLRLEIEPVPDSPARARRGKWGVGPLVILGAGAGLFVFFWVSNATVGNAISDDLAFEEAKQGGAPALRAYLLDERNTKHRDEAKQLIAKAYDGPVLKVQNLAVADAAANRQAKPGIPDARKGLVALLDSLRTADQGAASIQFSDRAANGTLSVNPAVRQQVADGLARGLDPKLIAFLAPPDGKPANIEIVFNPRSADTNLPEYQITIRVTPTDPPVADVRVPLDPNTMIVHAQKVSEILVGGFVQPPPPPPPEDF